jgi:hypothetical protein
MNRLDVLKQKVAINKPMIQNQMMSQQSAPMEMYSEEGLDNEEVEEVSMEGLQEDVMSQESFDGTYDLSTFALSLFTLRTQLHIWHLQTKSFAEHKALNSTYDDLLVLLDSYIEKAQGKTNTVIRVGHLQPKELCDYQPQYMRECIRNTSQEYQTLFLQIEGEDLKNVMAEILGLLNELEYLLTLN